MPVAAALALAAADLVTAGRGVNDLAPRALLTSRPPVLALLDQSAGPERLYTPPVSNLWLNRSLVRGPAGWPQAWGFAPGLQESLEAPIGARWGLRGSYDADFTGLAPPRLPTLSSVVARYADSAPGVRLLRMAG